MVGLMADAPEASAPRIECKYDFGSGRGDFHIDHLKGFPGKPCALVPIAGHSRAGVRPYPREFWQENLAGDLERRDMTMAQEIAAARAEVQARVAAARQRAGARFGGEAAGDNSRTRELVAASRQRVRALLDRQTQAAPTEEARLSIHALHTLDRLLSYVRHSVVRMCFYNLKLFCPSLRDEYDAHVRENVLANLGQLPRVRQELSQFFDEPLEEGASVGRCFPDKRRAVERELAALADLAQNAKTALDIEASREEFSIQAPAHVDATMKALQDIQSAVDTRRVALGPVLEEAAALARPRLEETGIAVETDIAPAPKVFAEPRALLNCFGELMENARKYSKADTVIVSLEESDDGGHWVVARVCDDGAGMSEAAQQACFQRGASTGGTGEGLPMVQCIIEEDHLGELALHSAPGAGCVFEVRLPVKLQAEQHSGERK